MICSRQITLSEHPSGLVFQDVHFLCEDCRNSHTEEDIEKFSKTIMQSTENGMPIALWLIHEQNKDKTIMSGKKQ